VREVVEETISVSWPDQARALGNPVPSFDLDFQNQGTCTRSVRAPRTIQRRYSCTGLGKRGWRGTYRAALLRQHWASARWPRDRHSRSRHVVGTIRSEITMPKQRSETSRPPQGIACTKRLPPKLKEPGCCVARTGRTCCRRHATLKSCPGDAAPRSTARFNVQRRHQPLVRGRKLHRHSLPKRTCEEKAVGSSPIPGSDCAWIVARSVLRSYERHRAGRTHRSPPPLPHRDLRMAGRPCSERS